MNLLLSLNRALREWPEREALVDGNHRYTYRQFGVRVNQLTRALSNLGIGRGQVVAIIAPNSHEFMEVYYAAASLGCILNPVNIRLSPLEISSVLQDSEASLLFYHTDFSPQVSQILDLCPNLRESIWFGSNHSGDAPHSHYYEDLVIGVYPALDPPSIEIGEIAHLYYTSGTTGKPKGVMLTHGNVACHALTAIAELSLSDRDTWLHAAPMFHLADAWATFAMTWVGAKHVFIPYFKARETMAIIDQERVTISNLIPTMLSQMLALPEADVHDFSSLRVLMSGGAPIAPETVKQIITMFGCDYVQTYGMTETSPYLTLSLLKSHLMDLPPEKQLSIKSRTGRPFAAVELKVVRPDGREVMPDDREVGEIIVRGPTVTPGYWKQPLATAEAIRNGWLYTGDLAVVDSEGYVNIVDRKKDMILTGGENVYSIEVEHILHQHPAVSECAVIGIPDSIWGEAVKAVVVVRPGMQASESALIDFVRDRLSHFKVPKSINFVDELPKTGSGKISKHHLKKRYQAPAD